MTSRRPLPWWFTAGLWMMCWPYLLFERYHNNFNVSVKRKAKRRRKEAAPPLPRSRRRALTLPLPKKRQAFGSKPQTHVQLQSPFFRLPQELRQLVYQEVFGRHNVHIVAMHGRLGSFPCTHSRTHGEAESVQAGQHLCWDRETVRVTKPANGVPILKTYAKTGIGALPLLRTCRTIYSETIDLLYAGRTFDFIELDAILGLSTSILPQRLNAITSVHLDGVSENYRYDDYYYALACVSEFHRRRFKVSNNHIMGGGAWEAICQVLTSMKNLQRLHIEVSYRRFAMHLYNGQGFTAKEELVFGPLRTITHPRVYSVEVEWPEFESFKKGNAPFQLTRRPIPNHDYYG